MSDMTRDELLNIFTTMKTYAKSYADSNVVYPQQWLNKIDQAYNQLKKIVERWFDGEPGVSPIEQSPDSVVDEELVDKILELATRWAEERFEEQKQTINLAHELKQLLTKKRVVSMTPEKVAMHYLFVGKFQYESLSHAEKVRCQRLVSDIKQTLAKAEQSGEVDEEIAKWLDDKITWLKKTVDTAIFKGHWKGELKRYKRIKQLLQSKPVQVDEGLVSQIAIDWAKPIFKRFVDVTHPPRVKRDNKTERTFVGSPFDTEKKDLIIKEIAKNIRCAISEAKQLLQSKVVRITEKDVQYLSDRMVEYPSCNRNEQWLSAHGIKIEK